MISQVYTKNYVSTLTGKCDSDEQLELYTVTDVSNETPSEVMMCRGLVFKGDELITRALPYAQEYVVDVDTIPSIDRSDDENRVFLLKEGTVIRVFYSGKWYVSTNRKLDAFNSRWGCSTTYGEFFKDAIERQTSSTYDEFLSTLNKNRQYLFLLTSNTENRIVCRYNTSEAIHIGTFNGPDSFDMDNSTLGLPRPIEIKNEDLVEYVRNVDPFKSMGVVIMNVRTLSQVKLLNKKYHHFASLRSNDPNVIYRYLKIRTNEDVKKEFLELYPEHGYTFRKCENVISKLIDMIYTAYRARFIMKQHATVPQEEYRVVKACHTWHQEDRANNRVFKRQVAKFFDEQPTGVIYRMVTRELKIQD